MNDGEDMRRRGDRAAVGLLIRLTHPDVDEFVEAFATNLSPGGVFIRTSTPQPIGTLVRFEIRIMADVVVMRGEATVRWVRKDASSEGPAGMGLAFEVLDEKSKALVARMLGHRGERQPGEQSYESDPELPAPSSQMVELELPKSGEVIASLFDDSIVPEGKAVEGTQALNFEPTEPEEAAPEEAAPEEAAPEKAAPEEAAPEKAAPEKAAPEKAAPSPFDLIGQPLGAAKATPPASQAKPVASPAAATQGLHPVRVPDPAEDLEIDVDISGEIDEEEDDIEVEIGDLVESTTLTPAMFLEVPEEIPDDGPIIGVDLGTTNSCVAIMEKGHPKIISSRQGYNTIPSVIAVSKTGKLLVGHPAKSQLLINPTRTVYGAKRLVGRAYDSPIVQQVAQRFHYPICADAVGRAAVQLGEKTVSLDEVQGLILREAKQLATESLGVPVHRAVVTVPAYYSDAQRAAVRRAGELSGLRVVRILNEPTAAALAYGLNREFKKKILIYDLGGGTFDATLMRIDSNVFEVLSTGGDTFLGGTDFDDALVEHLLGVFEQSEGIPFAGDRMALSRVTDAAENAKIQLSECDSVEVRVPYLMVDTEGVPHDLLCTVDRKTLETLHRGLVDRSLEVVGDILLDAGALSSEVDEVILVGGQSRSPLVREMLEAYFGRPPHPGVHPDEAVGLGAALLANSLGKMDSVVLIDVLPMTLGVGLPGGRFHRIIDRNTPLPAHKTYGLRTTRRNQSKFEISVFQGEDDHVAGNEYLGTATLSDLPKGGVGDVKVAVSFNLGPDCLLSVEAKIVGTGTSVKTQLVTAGTPDEIRHKLHAENQEAEAAQQRRVAQLKAQEHGFMRFLKRLVGQ